MQPDDPNHADRKPGSQTLPKPENSGSMKDLAPRIASAVVMAAVAFGLLYAGPMPFTALVLIAAVVMSWEWGAVVRGDASVDAILVVHVVVVAAAVILAAGGYAALGLIGLIAGTLVVGALRFGETARLSAVGVLYTGMPAVALIELRAGEEPYGFAAVLFVLLCVIATDTLAYFTGRAIGGPKLWPSVSPNKTWSGFIGGVSAAAVVGLVFAGRLAGASPARLAILALVLGIVSQGGDLAESALKRGFGVKDASSLLPGHGGLMDRLDGIVAAAIAAVLIGLAYNIHTPARALLLGF
jgi:phosphatidate cytidylyltransferase